MKTAIVTTCLNEGDSITQWISDIDGQSVVPDEVVVVDAGSTDGTFEALQNWRSERFHVKVVSIPKCSVALGRNEAIRATDAEILASTDMGCRLNSIWFEKIVEPFRVDPSTQVVAGNFSADLESLQSAVAWADYYLYGKFAHVLKEGMLPPSRSIAYRREVWEQLGGYPEDLRYAGDDLIFAMQIHKAKYKMSLAPHAMAYWRRHNRWKAFFREAFLYGRGAGEAHAPLPWAPRDNWTSAWLLVACIRFFVSFAGKNAIKSTAKAFLDGRFAAALRVQLLGGLKAFMYTKGYADGYSFGALHCSDCRKRIA